MSQGTWATILCAVARWRGLESIFEAREILMAREWKIDWLLKVSYGAGARLACQEEEQADFSGSQHSVPANIQVAVAVSCHIPNSPTNPVTDLV
jgi:hypothetical protein